MLRKFKSLLALVVTAMLILSVISACVSGTKTPDSTKDDTKGSEIGDSLIDPSKKIEISYYSYWCGDIVDGNYCERLVEEALNLEIKAKKVNHTKKEQVDLMLASGDMPDCGWFTYNPQYMYYEQELTRLIPLDMIKKYAPSYLKTYDKFPILYKQITSKEDKNQYYALVGHQANMAGAQYFFCNFYRKDWLDKFGIKPDTPVEEVIDRVFITEKGFTLEQFEEILRQFTEEDPDENGQDDTVGMLGSNQSFEFCWAPLMGAFGIVPSFSVEENGKAVYYYSTERYKEFLKYISRLNKLGYMDKEILTLDWQQFWEKAQNGYGGYLSACANWLGSWAIGRPPLNILDNIPGSKILMTPGQIGPDGSMGTRMYGATPLHGWFYVNKNVKDDEKLARILQFAEYTGYGEDRLYLIYGEEGVDFDMVDDKPVRREGFVHGGNRGLYTYSLYVQDEEVLGWGQDVMFAATEKYTLGIGGLWNRYLKKPYRYDLENVTRLSELSREYGSNISDIVNEYFAEVLTGEADIDSTWDAYLSKLKAAGYDEILEELQKAPLYEDLIKIN
jgi:ABC-type glycerol-3-phosphate transport system substrate-binding protein